MQRCGNWYDLQSFTNPLINIAFVFANGMRSIDSDLSIERWAPHLLLPDNHKNASKLIDLLTNLSINYLLIPSLSPAKQLKRIIIIHWNIHFTITFFIQLIEIELTVHRTM